MREKLVFEVGTNTPVRKLQEIRNSWKPGDREDKNGDEDKEITSSPTVLNSRLHLTPSEVRSEDSMSNPRAESSAEHYLRSPEPEQLAISEQFSYIDPGLIHSESITDSTPTLTQSQVPLGPDALHLLGSMQRPDSKGRRSTSSCLYRLPVQTVEFNIHSKGRKPRIQRKASLQPKNSMDSIHRNSYMNTTGSEGKKQSIRLDSAHVRKPKICLKSSNVKQTKSFERKPINRKASLPRLAINGVADLAVAYRELLPGPNFPKFRFHRSRKAY